MTHFLMKGRRRSSIYLMKVAGALVLAENTQLLRTEVVSLDLNGSGLEQNTNPNVKLPLDMVNHLNIMP